MYIRDKVKFLILDSICLGILLIFLMAYVIKLDIVMIIFFAATILFCGFIIARDYKRIKLAEKILNEVIKSLLDEHIKLYSENTKLKSICDSDIIEQ